MSSTNYAQLARDGDVEALFAIADMRSKADRNAYKWLCAASDFGHEEADDRIDDVLEVTSMRYDDGGFEVRAAHWELAVGYLTGDEGLPVDLDLARRHLETAFDSGDPDAINEGTGERYEAGPVLARLTGDARRVLEVELAGGDLYRRVETCIERVLRLRECRAPEVVVDAEKERLRAAAETFFGAGERATELASIEKRSLEALDAKVKEALQASALTKTSCNGTGA